MYAVFVPKGWLVQRSHALIVCLCSCKTRVHSLHGCLTRPDVASRSAIVDVFSTESTLKQSVKSQKDLAHSLGYVSINTTFRRDPSEKGYIHGTRNR